MGLGLFLLGVLLMVADGCTDDREEEEFYYMNRRREIEEENDRIFGRKSRG